MMSAPDRPQKKTLFSSVADISWSDGMALTVLALGWIAICILIDPIGDFPLNDDWVYTAAVRSILTTGHFALPSPASANVIVQAYWGSLFCLPFGFSFTALRVATFTLGGSGIAAVFLLLREIGAATFMALTGALALAFNPVYFGLSASFMTDVPFTALFTISLWLYMRGVRRDAAFTVLAAIAFAFAAIFIRQFGLVLLLGFGCAQITRKGAGARALIIAVLPVLLGFGCQLAYDHWLIAASRTPHIPAPLGQLLAATTTQSTRRVGHVAWMCFVYLGFYSAPLVACLLTTRGLTGKYRLARRPAVWVAGFLLTAIGLQRFAHADDLLPSLGNTLTLSGFGPLTLRDSWILKINEPQIPGLVRLAWGVVTLISICAAMVCLTRAAEVMFNFARDIGNRARRENLWRQVLLLTIIISYVAGVLLIGYANTVFDRYLIPLIPPILALLLIDAAPFPPVQRLWRLAPCLLLLAFYALFSILATHDYLAWSRARWQASYALLKTGISPRHIDGGYEFNGWYLYDANYQETSAKSYWWVTDDRYIIACGPLPGYVAVARFHVDRWLGLGERNVLVLRRIGG